MTITNVGFGGEINAAIWGDITSYLGHRFCVRDEASWRPLAVASERRVSIGAGIGFGHGVLSDSDAAVTLELPTPAAGTGRWYLVVARRTWPVDEGAGTTEFFAFESFTTGTAAAGLPPTYVGADGYIHEEPGAYADQPIAWAHVNGSNTAVVIQDLRIVRDGGFITAPVPVFDTNWRRTLGEEAQSTIVRQGSVVILHLNLQSASGSIGGRRGQRVCVIPESFRPASSHAFAAAMVDGTAEGLVELGLNTAGNLTVLWASNTSATRMRVEYRYNINL